MTKFKKIPCKAIKRSIKEVAPNKKVDNKDCGASFIFRWHTKQPFSTIIGFAIIRISSLSNFKIPLHYLPLLFMKK
jgi:hypothetical protein